MANQVQLQPLQQFSYIENMVSKPTWKDILLELIASNSIDPWNIDLITLADGFIRKVKEMERMDFVVQANVILAASILLKYKSDYLKALSVQTEIPEFAAADEAGFPEPEALPQLTLSSRIPPKRQITLDELVSEMERIIKYDEVERVRIPRGGILETIDMDLGERNIEEDMALTMAQVRENTDSEGWSLFSRLIAGRDMRDTVYTLLCVLHLVQLGSLDLKQDKMFGEIFIFVPKEKQAAPE
ncbi:segregation/condensation protein A [Candidatus Micrarchaeota archaeon]|nr:segregation/condensation protein A [Candidatus Micrarchaeota archaeon]